MSCRRKSEEPNLYSFSIMLFAFLNKVQIKRFYLWIKLMPLDTSFVNWRKWRRRLVLKDIAIKNCQILYFLWRIWQLLHLFHMILFQLEETKRRQKIEMWDSMQEGKSYKGNARKPQVSVDWPSWCCQVDEGLSSRTFFSLCMFEQDDDSPGPSTSSVIPKRKSDRKPLRGGGEYQMLTHSKQLQNIRSFLNIRFSFIS